MNADLAKYAAPIIVFALLAACLIYVIRSEVRHRRIMREMERRPDENNYQWAARVHALWKGRQ